MKPKFVSLIVVSSILGLTQASHAQTTFFWRAEASDGTWQLANNWWDGVQTATPGGSEILRFANDVQVAMSNDLILATRHRIFFDSGATAARTISGTVQNEFVGVSSDAPMIRNDSTTTHAVNFPILIDTQNLVIHPATAPLSLGGVISGTAGLTKEGADVLTLSGANNYSGVTSINAGTLSISAENNLGTTPGAYVANQISVNGGTLKTAVGLGISTNRGLTIGSSGATLDNSTAGNGTNLNLNSKITGTGNLTLKANGDTSDSGGGVGGNLTLGSNSNDFIGNITIQSGVVNFASDAAFGNAANTITITGGGLVCTASTNSLAATRSIILSGGGNKIFRAYGSSTFTVNGPISGTGNVRHTDGGTLVLNGTNSFTGNIDNVRGNLTLTNSAHIGNIVNSSGTLTLANSAHTGNVTNSAGTLILNAGNTYTGYTHITSSTTLRLDADNALPDGTTVLLYGGTTFNANGKTDTLGSLTTGSSGDTTVTVNLGAGANLTITNNSLPAGMTSGYGNATVHGKITGTGTFTYNHATINTALWDWANTTNDFTGNVTVTQGRLRVISDAAVGNAANDLVFNGIPVATFGNGEGKASIQVTNGTNLTLGAGRDIVLNTGKEGTMYVWGGTTMTIDGKVTGGGNLRKEDTGILLLNNAANDWSGEIKLAVGEIRIGTAGALSPASTPVIAGGTFNLNGIASSVTGLSGGGNAGGNLGGGTTLTVTGNGNYDYSGRVTDTYGGSNNGVIVKYTGSGSLTLSGTADNSGGRATVDSGTLILGKTSSGSVHSVGTNNVTALTVNGGICQLGGTGNDQIYIDANVHMAGGTFDLNERNEGFRGLTGTAGLITNNGAGISLLTVGQQSVAADTCSFAGSINDGTGQIDLTKTGAGTLVLTGASNYTGFTTVNGGILRVQGSLGNTPTLVSSAIGGNGSVGGQVSLLSGGGIANSISDWNGTAGTGFDDLAVQSLVIDPGPHTITIDTSSLVNFSETAKTFPIVTTTGGITGFDELDFTVSAPGFTGTGTWSVQQTLNNLELVYTVSTDPYDAWATAKGLTPANNGKSQDADDDGRTNLQEFAFDGDPLSGTNDGKMVTALADPDGAGPETTALTLTLPVRTGAAFSGPGDLVSAAIDGVIYQIQGSDDLLDFTSMNVSEISPALSTGLPGLSTGWSYRTFRSPGTLDEPDTRDFLRAGVEEEVP